MALPLLRACVAPVITTGAVTSDASTAIGDLIVFVGWSQGADQSTLTHTLLDATNSWLNHPHNDGTDDARFGIAVKVVSVAGAQSYTPWTIANATAGQISIGQYIVQAGTYDPAIVATLPAANISAASGTTNAVPNSPQLSPTTALDYIFLSIGAWHLTASATHDAGAPTSYTMRGENNPAVAHVTHLAITDRSMSALAAPENPGGFTDNMAPNGTVACTVAIPGVPPAQNAAAGLAIATGTGLASTVTPGGVSVAAGLATSASSALDATASIGAAGLNAAAGLATSTATGLDASVTPGAVQVAAGLATGAPTALAATVTPGPVQAAAGVAIAIGAGLGATVTPGAVSAAAGLAGATSSALGATAAIVTIVPAGLSTAAVTALGASVTPGPVAVPGGLAVSGAAALDASVTAGPVSTSAGLVGAAAEALDASVTPGPVQVAAGLASAASSAMDAAVTQGSEPEAQFAAAGLALAAPAALTARAYLLPAVADFVAPVILNSFPAPLALAGNGASLSLTDTRSSLTLDPS